MFSSLETGAAAFLTPHGDSFQRSRGDGAGVTPWAINTFPFSFLHCFLSHVPRGNPTVSHTWNQPRATTSTYLMQQPPQLLMIKYNAYLLGNFSGQKAKSSIHWGQKLKSCWAWKEIYRRSRFPPPMSVTEFLASLKTHCGTACV